eukprot:g1431.t1
MQSCLKLQFPFLLLVSNRRQTKERIAHKLRAYQENGTGKIEAKSSYIDMTVASDEFDKAPTKLRVPDPTHHQPRPTIRQGSLSIALPTMESSNDVFSSLEDEEFEQEKPRTLSGLQKTVLDSSLQRRNRELAAAHLAIQSKDKELKLLKQSLSEMERLFAMLKVERISYRQKLDAKDNQLTEAYQSLVDAAEERTQLHQELFEMEQELLEVRKNTIAASTTEEGDQAAGPEPVNEEEDVASMVQRLSQMSAQLVEDAQNDEEGLSGQDAC